MRVNGNWGTMTVAENLKEVLARIEKAAAEAGRDPAEVTLVAVSKTFPADDIVPVIEAGQRVFGENRVQEAKAKWPELKQRFDSFDPNPEGSQARMGAGRSGRPLGAGERSELGVREKIELHLIGPLQSNKAREAVALFDVIHTVDRDRIAEALAVEIRKSGRHPTLFVQVNTGAEPQKAGVLPEQADAFIARCRDIHGLEIAGVMCIPPFDEAPAPHFALLEKIARRNGLKNISMGMSGDYEIAVAHGATHVRVGSAIFGARDYGQAG